MLYNGFAQNRTSQSDDVMPLIGYGFNCNFTRSQLVETQALVSLPHLPEETEELALTQVKEIILRKLTRMF